MTPATQITLFYTFWVAFCVALMGKDRNFNLADSQVLVYGEISPKGGVIGITWPISCTVKKH